MKRSVTVANLRKIYDLGAPQAGGDTTRPDASNQGERLQGRYKEALKGISFAVSKGERVGIVGANGAGKSTLLQILAGVTFPTSGVVEIDGRVHAILTLGIGLREDLTGRENLYLDGEIQGKSRAEIEPMIDGMIGFTELGAFIDRPVRTYSTGMKSRLAFASLVFIEPDILLIDEALSAGDYHFARKASSIIRDLCAAGNIVILASHSREAIIEMCTRCIWIDDGKIMADGDATEVTDAYYAELRRRDEEEIAADFARHSHSWWAHDRAIISRVEVSHLEAEGHCFVLSAEDPARVRVALALSQPGSPLDLRIRLRRWDGLVVSDTLMREVGIDVVSRPGAYEFCGALAKLNLRPTLYTLEAELLEDGVRIAESQCLFKVISNRISQGGEPALRSDLEAVCRPATLAAKRALTGE